MLRKLDIQNYAIIQAVRLEFDKGLNIITGETGAGKSILIGALGLCLGDRADTKVLYNDDSKCIVEASFDLSSYKLERLFEELDLDYEAITIIRREISPNGKSRAFVNDTPVTLETLRQITENLVNLTSQNETQQLNKEAYQLAVVDATAGHETLLNDYKGRYREFKQVEKQLKNLEENQAKLDQDYDYNQFQLQEIEAAQLEGENLEDLENELSTLSHAESIKSQLQNLLHLIDEGETSILSILNEAFYQLKDIQKFSENIAKLSERIDSSIIELEDIKNEAEDIASNTEYDEERINELSERVNEANRLLKKHQLQSIDELMNLRNELQILCSSKQQNTEEISALQKAHIELKKKLEKAALALRSSRQKASIQVVEDIQNTLHQVGMPEAVFEVNWTEKNEFTLSGKDQVQFLFNANKGFTKQALNKIASGGELSRVLLSIQALLAQKTSLPTLIFDEIDTGISGETAAKVAEVFRKISKKHQLIAITHLPQIAAKAEQHFFIYKNDEREKTETKIATLNAEQHVKAIARMLSGQTISEESMNNARSLIKV
jgi:DNA repair protein RecN (Recombination protein N)